MTYFTDEQIALLLKPIHPNRVLQLKGLSYVEGHDIRAELNRVFGFGRWSEETLDQQLVCETETKTSGGKAAWYVVYRTRVRLTIHAPDGTYLTFYDGAHVGESTHPVRGEAHGNALTNSQTYALKRAAHNLGDQFGLGLYAKGSLEPIVRWTLVRPEKLAVDTDDVLQVQAEESASVAAETVTGGAAPITVTPGKTRSRTVAAKPPVTFEELVEKITSATTVDELRVLFKDAGTAGALDTGIPGGKITVRDLLYRRNDEIAPAKSDGAGTEDPGENPGTPAGDK